MYITLKGIGKILFVSALRNLLICKFLNFTVVFTKKIKLCIQFWQLPRHVVRVLTVDYFPNFLTFLIGKYKGRKVQYMNFKNR